MATTYEEDGKRYTQGILLDVTESKQHEAERERLELQLRLAQKLEAVGQLAAGLAHEINTPIQFLGDSVTFLKQAADDLLALTAVYRELLHSDEPIDRTERRRRALDAEADSDLEYLVERIRAAVERALAGVDRVASIVRATRQFAHPATERTAVDLNEAIRTTLVVARSEYKYVADIELDLVQLPLVTVALGDINQVLLNLIVNAAQAIGSCVQDSGERGRITIRTRPERESVVVTVHDTGGGISPAIAGRVFDPFFTTKPVGQGTGQGLAIAHTIITERHHGTIDFETTPGVGTTFRICLPREHSDPADAGHRAGIAVVGRDGSDG